MLIDQRLTGRLDGLGLLVEVARRADVLRQFLHIRGRERFRVGIFLEQRPRHLVDALVGALRRQDGRHQQLHRRFPLQLVACVGVMLVQSLEDDRQRLFAFRSCHVLVSLRRLPLSRNEVSLPSRFLDCTVGSGGLWRL